MNKIAILSLIVLGFIIFIIGIILGDVRLNAVGFIIIILTVFYVFLKEKEVKKKSILYYIENKDESVLPLSKSNIKKKEIKISLFLTLFISIVAFALAWNMLSNYLFAPSPLSIENIINKGCTELVRGTCDKDPSTIVVPYDVNKDGIVGGINDTLSNLLKMSNCTDACIKRRCGCIGY
jgi:hypothetical protein